MRVAVVGAGHMGHAVAWSYAVSGHSVVLMDKDETALERAKGGVTRINALMGQETQYRSAVQQLHERLVFSTDLNAACKDADLVQEALPEELELKQHLFRRVEGLAPESAILATNTSSLRISAITKGMERPDRVVGIHWVSPAFIVPVVEVVRSRDVSESTIAAVTEMLREMGRIPLEVPDVPGFVINRLQSGYRLVALRMVEEGIASPHDIDVAVKYGIAPRQTAFGMFRLYDLVVSAQTSLAVGEYLFEETGDPAFEPSDLMRKMVAEGRLGLVSGRGWYEYSGLSRTEVEDQRDIAFLMEYSNQRRKLEPIADWVSGSPQRDKS